MASISDKFAEQRDGSLVSIEARDLLVDLDLRGLAFTVNKGLLRVSNKDGTRPELSDEDRAAISLHKPTLLYLVGLSDEDH